MSPSGAAMPARPAAARRPAASYLLRVHEVRVEHVLLRYELIDLASGATREFASLAALQRHLRASGGDEAAR
jgi:hypothetical protein